VSENAVTVTVAGHSYDVLIEKGLLSRAGQLLRKKTAAQKVALITDDTVAARFGLLVSASLARADFEVLDIAIPAGERSKNWGTTGEVLEAVAEHGLRRNDLVIALGGGVVGDLAGFVAATYLRGVEFAQIPTTLLAMVDSSVGGKTGVDLMSGKNLAGAFKQPIAVLADTATLGTLPDTEWQSGLAEVAKSAVIDGEEFTAWLEANAEALVTRDAQVVAEAIRRCVEFKAAVVEGDERESGPRECLNYGHTLGHAIEKVAGYGTFTHGVAVAEGMRFASRLSMDVAEAEVGFVKRQDRLLAALGLLPIEDQLSVDNIHAAMRSDKKSRASTVRFVVVNEPGVWRCEPVSDVTLAAHLAAWAATKVKEEEVEPEPEQESDVAEQVEDGTGVVEPDGAVADTEGEN
jgi:3-dehydroquinate synthase